MAQYDPSDASELGFIDETSKDEQTPGRHYGWSKKGGRVEKDCAIHVYGLIFAF